MEQDLKKYVRSLQSQGSYIKYEKIRQKALELASDWNQQEKFKASDKWIVNFLRNNQIILHDSGAGDVEDSVAESTVPPDATESSTSSESSIETSDEIDDNSSSTSSEEIVSISDRDTDSAT
jgi:hypothetical protein